MFFSALKKPTPEELEQRQYEAAKMEQRARIARELLEHEAYKTAMNELKAAAYAAWRVEFDTERRNQIWMYARALEDLDAILGGFVATGNAEKVILEQLKELG
jgi:uncharacterized protein (DUF427 family)